MYRVRKKSQGTCPPPGCGFEHQKAAIQHKRPTQSSIDGIMVPMVVSVMVIVAHQMEISSYEGFVK